VESQSVDKWDNNQFLAGGASRFGQKLLDELPVNAI